MLSQDKANALLQTQIQNEYSVNRNELNYILQFNAYLFQEDRNVYIKQVLGLPAFSPDCEQIRKNQGSSPVEGQNMTQYSFSCFWTGGRQRNQVTKMNLASDFSVIRIVSRTHCVKRPSVVLALLRNQFKAARMGSIWVRDVVFDLRMGVSTTTRQTLQSGWLNPTPTTGENRANSKHVPSVNESHRRRRARPPRTRTMIPTQSFIGLP